MNESLPDNDQDFLNIYDSRGISTLLFEDTVSTFYEIGDETYEAPSSDDDMCSDSDSEGGDGAEDEIGLIIGPSLENMPVLPEIDDDSGGINISYDNVLNHPLIVFQESLLELATFMAFLPLCI